MRAAAEIALSKEERRRLETWASTRSTSAGLRERARIVLRAAEGMTNKEIAAQLQVDANKVGRWRARVAKEGTSSIEKERPRGANHGGKNTKKQAQFRSEVVEATTQTTPNDATHWSCRSMARHLNTTHSFVNRVWRAHGLKPHLIRTVKLSNDPRFEEKLRDVVGAVPRPAAQRRGVQLCREEPDPSPGPHAARFADEEGALRDDDTRLQTSRYHHVVRGVEHGYGRGDRQDLSKAPTPRGVEVSARGSPQPAPQHPAPAESNVAVPILLLYRHPVQRCLGRGLTVCRIQGEVLRDYSVSMMGSEARSEARRLWGRGRSNIAD